jgi:hypothetical protein
MAQHHEERALGPNRVDQEQYALLKQCAEAGDATAWNDWRRQNPDAAVLLQGVQLGSLEARAILRRIDLHGANLARAKLTGAILVGADLRGAVLVGATLHSAILVDGDLREANLLECDLRGANLRRADLRSTQAAYSKVDGETLLLTDRVDSATDFTGVPLEAMRIEPGLPQLLSYNVRRERWRQWYRRHRVLAVPARMFWIMCDYGHSTWRVLLTFSVLALAFATAYTLFPQALVAVWAGQPGESFSFVYALYFSIVTMTTLGFGDVYAAPNSILGQFLLSLQVVLGYVLLGALVTRFAVLFTAGGPSASFYREPGSGKPPEKVQ